MFGNEHHHHHRSPFPVVVILLTIALIVFMVVAFTDSKNVSNPRFESTSMVSQKEYQKEMGAVLKNFFMTQDRVEDDLQKLLSAEQTLSSLLSMKVPAQDKSIHLELALSLNMMQSGLRSDERDGSEGYERFKKTVSRFSWIEL